MSVGCADQHDLDKLGRWYQDMVVETTGRFSVYGLFLVSEQDHRAHEIFREYRSSFQVRNVPYQYLIIFGQHGVSTTVLGLLRELKLSLESLPLLAFFDIPSNNALRVLPLDTTELSASEGPEPWKHGLARIEEVAGVGAVDLALLPGTTEIQFCERSILGVVQRLLERLS